jgi:hypothetical protein
LILQAVCDQVEIGCPLLSAKQPFNKSNFQRSDRLETAIWYGPDISDQLIKSSLSGFRTALD